MSVGSTVALVCEVTIDSSYDVVLSAEINWSGPRLNGSKDGYNTTQSGSGLSYVSVLTISEVFEEDEGDYRCSVSTFSENQHVLSSPANSTIRLSVGKYTLEL